MRVNINLRLKENVQNANSEAADKAKEKHKHQRKVARDFYKYGEAHLGTKGEGKGKGWGFYSCIREGVLPLRTIYLMPVLYNVRRHNSWMSVFSLYFLSSAGRLVFTFSLVCMIVFPFFVLPLFFLVCQIGRAHV